MKENEDQTLKEDLINKTKIKKKKGINIFIVIGIIIAVILIVGYSAYYALSSNSKTLYKTIINSKTGDLVELLEEFDDNIIDIDLIKDSLLTSGDIKFNTSIDELKTFENYNYDYELGLDINNLQAYGNLKLSDKNEDILNIKASLEDEILYGEAVQLFDQIVSTTFDDLGIDIDLEAIESGIDELDLETLTIKEITYLLEEFSKHLGNSFIDDEFKKRDGTLKVNGSTLDVTKHTYEITDEIIIDMAISFLEATLEDDELLEIIEKTLIFKSYQISLIEFGSSAENIPDISAEEAIEDLIDNLKDIETNKEELGKITLYSSGIFNLPVGLSIEVLEEEVFLYTEKDKEIYISVMGDLIELVGKEEKNKIEFEVKTTLTELEKLDFAIGVDKNVYTLEVDTEIDSIKADIKASIEFDKQNDEELNTNIKIEAKLSDGLEDIEVETILNNTIKTGDKLPTLNKDAIDIKDLSSDDLIAIIDNLEDLLEKEPIKSFMELVENIGPSYDPFIDEPLDDDDYSFDDKNYSEYNNLKNITYDDIYFPSSYGDEMILLISSSTCGYCDQIKPELDKAMSELGKIAWVIDINNLNDTDLDFLKFDFPFSGTPTLYHVVDGNTNKSTSGYQTSSDIINFIN